MATLLQNSTVTLSINPGRKIDLVTAASSSAVVERFQGDTLLDKTAFGASENFTYGPYLIGTSYKITCLTGSMTYTEGQSTDMVGEYVSSSVAIGSAVALTTNVAANITSISLTAGEWDISGSVGYAPTATTSMTHLSESISIASATEGSNGSITAVTFPAIVPGSGPEWFQATPNVRLVLASTTTVYLVAHALFTVSTLGGYGTLRARRIR